jgi:glutamate/tyrosine decarboxylase-like PLP-dependent enzyme
MNFTLDPANWPEFRSQAHRILDDALDYLERVRDRPVWRPIPPEVRAGFRQPLPRSPTPLETIHERFLREVLPFATGNVHPGFMGWVHGGGTPVGVVAELLAAAINANLGGRDHAPIEVERQVVAWMRELLGFPDSASGLFVTGSSMANFIALLVARTGALGPEVRREGVAAGGRRLTGYACATAHRCVTQAFELAGLGSAALRIIPADARYRMDLAALRASVQADREAGCTPFLVVGTAGTVDVGAIDDLASIADFAREERLWFHVDGAFGALRMLAPDVAPRLAGIERANSVALDFHKWAQVPYDAGFVLVRDGALHRATFAAPAPYLRSQPRGLAAGAPWPSEFGPDLSRGFRALKTWFTLEVYGADRLGAVISGTCALARQLAKKIEATPALELLAPVELNIVCFRYRAADADRINAEIVADLHESGIAAPSTTTLQGRLAIRAALFNHRTEPRDLDALIEATVRFGAQRARGE